MPVHANLLRAFEERADGVQADGKPLVGVFGEGVPVPLVSALGGLAVDVKAPPLCDAVDGPEVDCVAAVAEPFLDSFTARFLHRFAAGCFDRFATLIFARDDVAGLAAYQYALELRRQRRLADSGPRLFLWNLLHTKSAATAEFNAAELARLGAHLSAVLEKTLDDGLLHDAVEVEARRTKALQALPSGGVDAFAARNAGRWMTPEEHCELLETLPQSSGPRIVLVGTSCDIPVLHEICAKHGKIIADLQDYGRVQPCAASAHKLLETMVDDALAPRAAPPERFTSALHSRIAEADLVVSSVNGNDDSFGWELPGLRRAAEAAGARFLDLGFRPFRPNAEWRQKAYDRVAEALA